MDPDPTSADDSLARALSALAHPVRIALLRQLGEPRSAGELRVVAGAPSAPPRPLARQTLQEHLGKLVEAGVVSSQDGEAAGRTRQEYLVNQQALFAVAEECRTLASIRPDRLRRAATLPVAVAATPFAIEGPCLVLVKGVDEGRVFPLDPGDARRREWVVGRRRGLPVSLDFDPFVSAENSRVVWEGGRYQLHDLPESRNGTWLNFQLLPREGRHALRTGDLIGVGRTILMMRE